MDRAIATVESLFVDDREQGIEDVTAATEDLIQKRNLRTREFSGRYFLDLPFGQLGQVWPTKQFLWHRVIRQKVFKITSVKLRIVAFGAVPFVFTRSEPAK